MIKYNIDFSILTIALLIKTTHQITQNLTFSLVKIYLLAEIKYYNFIAILYFYFLQNITLYAELKIYKICINSTVNAYLTS